MGPIKGRTVGLLTLLLGLAFPLVFASCEKSEIVEEPEVLIGEPFDVSLSQYSTNYFFVDTSYIPYYEPYYLNDPPAVNSNTQIVEAKVWITKQGAQYDPEDRMGIAYMNLPERPTFGYDSSMRTSVEIPGLVERAKFQLLSPDLYSLKGDGYIGVLSLLSVLISDQRHIAIAYRRADGKQFGEFLRDGFYDDTSTVMILKLVKPRNLFSIGPRYSTAWKLLLKNIYRLGPTYSHVSRHYFALDVFWNPPSGQPTSTIQNQRLLHVLGLDRYNVDGTPSPTGDGIFDWRQRMTIDQQTGEITFPWVRPLDDGIREYFEAHGLPPPDPMYLFPELYDTTQTVAAQSSSNRYVVRGSAIFD